MAGGRKLSDPELEELAQRIAKLLGRRATIVRKQLPLCDDCGHRHRVGDCDDVCPFCNPPEG